MPATRPMSHRWGRWIPWKPPKSLQLPAIRREHLLLLSFILLLCHVHAVHGSLVEDLHRSRIARYAPKKNETTKADINEPPLDTNRPDTVCNPGGDHECVCNRSRGDLDERIALCDRFVEKKRLTVVSIVMRNVKLDVLLHTNESYQQYFRRRIANIVSQYCEQHANECPGTMLKMTKEHVVILRVNYLPRRRTEVQFVVTKQPKTVRFHDLTLIESEKVKKILAGQLAPLARVLGGIQIERLQLVDIDRQQGGSSQNYGLLVTLTVIGSGLLICYTIACIKVCRDQKRKRRSRESPTMLGDKSKRNYGTCADKLLASCEAPNGKPKSKSIASRASVSSTGNAANNKNRRISATNGANGRRSTQHSHSSGKNQGDENENSIALDIVRTASGGRRSGAGSSPAPSGGTPPLASAGLDTRSFQRMFACDLSQLPAESSELIDERPEDEDGVFDEDPFSRTSPAAPLTFGDTAAAEVHQQPSASFAPKEVPSIAHEAPSDRPAVPPPIVIGSQFSIDKVDETYVTAAAPKTSTASSVAMRRPEYQHQDSNDSIAITPLSFNPPAAAKPQLKGLLSVDDDAAGGLGVPFQRPLSRRGSRDSTPEQGGEEFADDSSDEEDDAPLGDKLLERMPAGVAISIDEPSSSAREAEKSAWSSESENEDEPREAYHPLREEEDEGGRKTGGSDRDGGLNAITSTEDSAVDEDDEEKRMLDRHTYERLEESPLPSPSTLYAGDGGQLHENNNTSGFPQTSTLKHGSVEEEPMDGDLAERLPSDYEDLR